MKVKGSEFRVGQCFCRSAQMVGCSNRKRFWLCRFRGNGRQGRHFHGETFDATAKSGAGFTQQGRFVQPDAVGPGRTRRQKDDPPVADIRESRLAGDCFGQEMAQSVIQRIQRARASRERVEGEAVRGRAQALCGCMEKIATWRHDEHETGVPKT